MVMNKKEATKKIYQYINQPDSSWKDKPEMVITDTIEKEKALIFYYTSSKWLQTGSISDAIAGNGPLIISKANGKIFTIDTSNDIEKSIEETLKEIR